MLFLDLFCQKEVTSRAFLDKCDVVELLSSCYDVLRVADFSRTSANSARVYTRCRLLVQYYTPAENNNWWGSSVCTLSVLPGTTEGILDRLFGDIIPTRRMVEEVCQAFNVKRDATSKVCKVWEDNAGALILANTPWPRLTPRSKHIAVKYHWFKEHIVLGEIEVLKIPTAQQKADSFTKSLPPAMFKEHRLMVCGW
jgi:hypothetical protein